MKTVFSFIKRYKWAALFAVLLMLMELFVELIQPMIMAKIIDDGILANNIDVIWQWGFILFILSIIAFTAGIVNSYVSAHVAHSFSFDLRNALFHKIQSFSMANYAKFPSSSLITRLTSDVTQVQTVVFMSLRIMLRAPLAVIGSLVMAFIVNAKLAVLLVIGVPILAIFLYIMATKGIQLFVVVQQQLDKVNRVLQENIQAVRLIKAYMRGAYEENRFEHVIHLLKEHTVNVLRIMELVLPTLLFVMNMSLLAVLWFGSQQIQEGHTAVGELVAVINYALRMTGSLSMFSFLIVIFARAKASAERMEEVLVVREHLEKIEDIVENSVCSSGTVRFEHVSFCYPNTKSIVLHDISFDVKAGEKLAIMGATGSGKTTLLSLIPRFYEATSGNIYVSGQEVREWSLSSLRQIIGYVPQQSLLFTGSIEDNIRWGKQDATIEEIKRATVQAQIAHTVMKFQDDYNTRVGQKGVNLSGGQKQRLSIARALVHQSQILILDDSTSALDVETESALWAALAEQNMTMLIVTQKIRTAKTANRILLLHEGKIESYGTHKELLETSSLYRQIAASQQEVEL